MTALAGPQYDSGFGNLLIKGIEEVTLPEKLSYLPQTIGWKVLAAILLMLLLHFLYRRTKRWWRNRYRREAQRQLLAAAYDSSRSPAERLAAMAALLKATALWFTPREEVASLSGEAWLAYLNQQTAPEICFSDDSSTLLTCAVYQQQPSVTDQQIALLADDITHWIKKHPEPETVDD